MKNKNHIFICGMPGSGKSSIVKPLAAELNIKSFDLDKLIEATLSIQIPNYIREKGETAFRDAETQTLQLFIKQNMNQPYIIALGGGTPCYNNNITLIKENGILIYLETSTDVLLQRLSGKTQDRPLLQDGTVLKDRLNTIIKEREIYYKEADFIVDGGKNIEHTLFQINDSLKNLLSE